MSLKEKIESAQDMDASLARALFEIEQTAPRVWRQLSDKLLHPDQWVLWAKEQRAAQRSIATVNGCFDLLHLGHLHMLFEARAQADQLIVALNCDQTIAASKGFQRPILPLSERLVQTAALSCVDFVTYFKEPDPLHLLQKIWPDVHINGAEYGSDCIESPTLKRQGAKLHLVAPLQGRSTSSLIKRIKSSSS